MFIDIFPYCEMIGDHDPENQLRQRKNDWTENNWIVDRESQKLFELFFADT